MNSHFPRRLREFFTDRLNSFISRFRIPFLITDFFRDIPGFTPLDRQGLLSVWHYIKESCREAITLIRQSPVAAIALAASLALCFWGDWTRMAQAMLWACFSIALCAGALTKCAGNWTCRIMAPCVGVGFLYFSGVGDASNPLLGQGASYLFHAIIISSYALFLWRVFNKAAVEKQLDKLFMGLDLWLFNLAFLALVLFWLHSNQPWSWHVKPLLTGLRHGLAPFSLIVAFSLMLRREDAGTFLNLSGTLKLSLLLLLAFSLARSGRIALDLGVAHVALNAEQKERAFSATDQAALRNERFGFPSFDRWALALRRNAQALPPRPERDLEELGNAIIARSSQAAVPERFRESLIEYLSPQPLAALRKKTTAWTSDDQIGLQRFLNRSLYAEPADTKRLLSLFVQLGRLDRLADYYAWAGFPEAIDLKPLETALLRSVRAGLGGVEAEFYLGVLYSHTGEPRLARDSFDRVLELRPGCHNTLVYIERLAATGLGSGRLPDGAYAPRHIPLDTAQGGEIVALEPDNQEGADGIPSAPQSGLQLSSIAWAPLETNSGRYQIVIEAKGKATGDQSPPTLAVFLDEIETEPVARATLSPKTWEKVKFDLTFDQPGAHRLILISESPESPLSKEAPTLEVRKIAIPALTHRR